MPESDKDDQQAKEATATREQNALKDATHDDDVYVHIVGQGAIMFNESSKQFELYALDDAGSIVMDSKVTFSAATGILMFNNLHLPIEVSRADAPALQTQLAKGLPHLRSAVETGDFNQSPFKLFMNCQPPPIGCPNRV
jgi:hypothetical protein